MQGALSRRTEADETAAASTPTEVKPEGTTGNSCLLPQQVHLRRGRSNDTGDADDAGSLPRALEFGLPGQW